MKEKKQFYILLKVRTNNQRSPGNFPGSYHTKISKTLKSATRYLKNQNTCGPCPYWFASGSVL